MFSNWKISRKLTFAFALILAVVIVFCGMVFASLSRIEDATARNRETQETLKTAQAILVSLVESQNAMRGFVASTNPEFIERMQKQADLVAPLVARLGEQLSPELAASAIPALKWVIETFQAETAATITAASDPARLEETRATIAKVARLTKIREIITTITDSELAAAADRQTVLTSTFERATVTLAVGGAVAGLAALAMGLLLAKAVAKPVVAMTAAMGALAIGNTRITVPAVGRKDEIGAMANAVEVFRANAVASLRLQEEAEAARNHSDQQRQQTAQSDRARADEMAQATEALGKGLKHLAGGNLTFYLSEPFAPDFETLRSDFNAAVTQLSKTLATVADATSGLDNGSQEVSSSANDLSKRTERQAASLEETAAALNEITANVTSSCNRADEARNVARQANESAGHSGCVVAAAVDAMNKIEQSSGQISNIIGVIDEIAFQTNLLALNAGVEAARAGDAGKGFAVVAQEVRELAQRSAQAAKEIKGLIRNSSSEVQGGVKLVSETGAALETIVGYIVTIGQHMDAIAMAAREQSVGLAEVNNAVNEMDQVTQQNAAMVEEMSAAGATLAGEAARLRDMISHFQLSGRAASGSVARASGRPVASARGAPAPRLAASHGNAALKQEEWSEF